MDESEQKKKFAIAVLHNPSDPFQCAKEIFGEDPGKCLQVFQLWQEDIEVRQYQADYLREHGADATLPTKETLAREIYDVAHDGKVDVDTRLKFYKLYGDILGFINKPGSTVTHNTQINNKVMVIKDHGTDENWEQNLIKQQQRLVSDNV